MRLGQAYLHHFLRRRDVGPAAYGHAAYDARDLPSKGGAAAWRWPKWWGWRGDGRRCRTGSRLDHLRHAARVRHRKPLAPVGDERMLLTVGVTNRGARFVNHVDQLVREAAAVSSTPELINGVKKKEFRRPNVRTEAPFSFFLVTLHEL